MTRTKTWAYRVRWWLLALGVLFTGAGIWGLFGFWIYDSTGGGRVLTTGTAGTPFMLPLESVKPLESPGLFLNAAITLGIVLLMQWAFLLPRRGWLPRLAKSGRPMALSLIAAAFMAMLLTAGAVITLLEINGAWESILENGLYAIWAVMGVAWLIWAVLFFMVYKSTQDRYSWMTRVLHRLIVGSFLEVFVATGVLAWNPQKNDECYCARGSYTGLVFGGTVLIWAFGPGLILLFMREKYRRERGDNGMICFNCGYDLRGATDKSNVICPECGEAMVLE